MPNRLIHESSPYLLQHAHNPVDWQPWDDQAREQAQRENKLILVSIGYAACHWCHVMEHESFADREVATLMNKHFVCIKVDREERPDVDKIYMDAVMLMNQQGGWPLNAVALPDGRPIYGGTYFPKESWMSVLQQLADLYHQQPERAEEYAKSLAAAMVDMDRVKLETQSMPFVKEVLPIMLQAWTEQIDYQFGGRQTERNKFPLPMNNLTLLRAAYFLPETEPMQEAAKEAARITLSKMAQGGIFDQIGGGFARYSVDAYWKVPHFEKMLYDNSQLVSVYAEAFQAADEMDIETRMLYRDVVYQTLGFVQRELRSPEQGFYSSLDADSEGEEGKFYVWTRDELYLLLGEDAKTFCDYYNVQPHGNWEGSNILFVLETPAAYAQKWNLDLIEFEGLLARSKKTLMEVRAKRIRPGLDDKILTAWNGLMIKGFVDAYRAFGEPRFLKQAQQSARFIQENLSRPDGQLFRNFKAGKASINAFLDDYAFMIEAYLALYQADFDEAWIAQAQLHMDYVHAHFFDASNQLFCYTSDLDPVLIKRKQEIQDDVIPSSNASIAHSLQSLGLLLGKSEYLTLAEQMLQNVYNALVQSPGWHAYWIQLLLRNIYPHYEVALTGPNAEKLSEEWRRNYLPQVLLAGGSVESKLPILVDRVKAEDWIYVCSNMSCQLPVKTVEVALEQIKRA